jgi:hypothetical protein
VLHRLSSFVYWTDLHENILKLLTQEFNADIDIAEEWNFTIIKE